MSHATSGPHSPVVASAGSAESVTADDVALSAPTR